MNGTMDLTFAKISLDTLCFYCMQQNITKYARINPKIVHKTGYKNIDEKIIMEKDHYKRILEQVTNLNPKRYK